MTTSSAQLSVVVIVDREQGLAELYHEYSAPLKKAGLSFEFVFLASADRGQLLQPLLELQWPCEPLHLFESAHNVGEAALLRSVLPHCKGEVLILLSTERLVAAEALPLLLQAVRDGADLVFARRSEDGDALTNRLQRRVAHALIRRLVGGSFHDLGSGVRAIRREALAELPLYGEFFRYLPLFAAREGFIVEERMVPRHPATGRRRLFAPGVYARRLNDLMAVFFLIRFREKPSRFFGLVGGFLSLAGFIVLAVLAAQRLAGYPLADRPMLVVGVLLLVLGLQSIALGLIGEIIVHVGAKRRSVYRLSPPRTK